MAAGAEKLVVKKLLKSVPVRTTLLPGTVTNPTPGVGYPIVAAAPRVEYCPGKPNPGNTLSPLGLVIGTFCEKGSAASKARDSRASSCRRVGCTDLRFIVATPMMG